MSIKRATASIIVAGREFCGWTSWSIESDFLQPSDAFHLSAPNIRGALAGTFYPGDSIKVLLDGEVQMVGTIADVDYDTQPDKAMVTVTGQDLLFHLVACSAIPKTYLKTDLLTLAELISPTTITGWTKTTGVVLTKRTVKVDPGEKKMEVLQRLCKKDDVLVWLTADGTPMIGRPDYVQEPTHKLRLWLPESGLTADNNMESCKVLQTMRDRYSSVTVYGHGGNTSSIWGKAAKQKSTATDSDLTIDWPLIVSHGDAKTIAEAKALAQREVDDRGFNALIIEAVARGHYGTPMTPTGTPELFQINQTVDLIDESSGQKGVFWISKRRFDCDEQGQVTHLTLRTPGIWLAK